MIYTFLPLPVPTVFAHEPHQRPRHCVLRHFADEILVDLNAETWSIENIYVPIPDRKDLGVVDVAVDVVFARSNIVVDSE